MDVTKEELTQMIRAVIAEERVESLSHPGQRAPVTRYTDPDGKTWVSTTLERGEMIRKALVIIGVVLASAVALIQFTNVWFLLPTMDARASQQIVAHEARVRQEMETRVPNFVSKSEFDRRVAASDAKWAAQDEKYKVLTEWMTRIEAKLDRLIERR